MAIRLSEQPYRSYAAFAAVVFVSAVAWWVVRLPDAPGAASPVPALERAQSSGEAPAETVSGESLEEAGPAEATEGIDAVQESRAPGDRSVHEESHDQEISAENLARTATRQIEQALDGDLQAAIGIPRLRNLCFEQFKDEGWVETEIEKLADYLKRNPIPLEGETMTLTGMEGLGYTIFQSEAENRAHLLNVLLNFNPMPLSSALQISRKRK